MTQEIAVVATRLVDMDHIHPHQDNSKLCSRCGARVGLYPTSQTALKKNPSAKIVCVPCALKDMRPDDINVMAAASWDEFIQEVRDSKRVGKA
jgi:hypothetical protein